MRELLSDLNKTDGVVGSLLVAPDGLLIASALPDAMKEEVIAAITSSAVLTLSKALKDLRAGDFIRCTLRTGKAWVLVRHAGAFLVALIAKRDANLGLLQGEMDALCDRIPHMTGVKPSPARE